MSTPSPFFLVGAMNSDEGVMRPQLLDRFGLCVDIRGIDDIDQRVAVADLRGIVQISCSRLPHMQSPRTTTRTRSTRRTLAEVAEMVYALVPRTTGV